jgi:hypothetical protein
MLEALLLLVLVALYGTGYLTRSYIGALLPGVMLLCGVIAFQHSPQTGDEVDAQAAIYVIAPAIGVFVYLSGVASGRARSKPRGGTEFR